MSSVLFYSAVIPTKTPLYTDYSSFPSRPNSVKNPRFTLKFPSLRPGPELNRTVHNKNCIFTQAGLHCCVGRPGEGRDWGGCKLSPQRAAPRFSYILPPSRRARYALRSGTASYARNTFRLVRPVDRHLLTLPTQVHGVKRLASGIDAGFLPNHLSVVGTEIPRSHSKYLRKSLTYGSLAVTMNFNLICGFLFVNPK